MDADLPVPELRVLAIASHVSYGYVGNKMATFVMQALGCDVSAIDTVHFSNHTAYKQFKGRKVPAEEIEALYEGMKESDLNDFDMMLSGYAATKEVAELVGRIAMDIQGRAGDKPGSFFWILDPVMGDEGRLYVAEDIVPVYRSLLPHADLILPNAFEAELLSEMKITDMKTLIRAITKLHKTHRVPHVVVTSLHISPRSGRRRSNADTDMLVVVGSSCRTDLTPRPFSITIPSLPVFFSGTGDMFAALMLVRLREASAAASNLHNTASWRPPDATPAAHTPLATACVKTLTSMHAVLTKTVEARADVLEHEVIEDGGSGADEKEMHLRRTKASEVRVVRYIEDLKRPKATGVEFEAVEVDFGNPDQEGEDEGVE